MGKLLAKSKHDYVPPLGHPIDAFSLIRVVDEDGRELAPGPERDVDGELQLGGRIGERVCLVGDDEWSRGTLSALLLQLIRWSRSSHS